MILFFKYTDASADADSAGFGVFLIIDGKRFVAGGDIPERLVNRWRDEVGQQIITQAEIYPVLLAKSKWLCVLLTGDY